MAALTEALERFSIAFAMWRKAVRLREPMRQRTALRHTRLQSALERSAMQTADRPVWL